jgi:hypothetical protein
LELRLDVVLVRIGLFKNVNISRSYIKNFGVFINDKRVYKINYILKLNDILSFDKNHRNFFKTKVFLKLKPTLNFIYNNKEQFSSFLGSFSNNKNLLSFDLELITFYVRLLFSNFPNNLLGRDLISLRSVFFVSYFPRFLEANFNTFEFICCSKIDPALDIKYPFKIKSNDVKKLIESTF